MKNLYNLKTVICSIVILFTIMFSANAQSPHTVAFSGSTTDFNAVEKYTSVDNVDYYVTFDATYVYFGAFRTGGSTWGSFDHFTIYLDTDPTSTPTTAGNGSATGVNWDSNTPSLPFRADYRVAIRSNGSGESFFSNYSSSWTTGATNGQGWSQFTTTAANGALEVRVPWSDLGNPSALYFNLYASYNGGFYAAAPGGVSGSAPSTANYFGGIGVSSADCIPIYTTNTPITASITDGVPASGATYGKVTVTTGTITNTNSWTLAPGGSLVVSGGTFAMGAQTITCGSAASNAGKGTTINTSGSGAITTTANSVFDFGGEGTVTGNALSINGGIVVRNKFTPLAAGALTIASGARLDIRNGGYINSNAPTYASGSNLYYNTGSIYVTSTEWTPNATNGIGVPSNVKIGNIVTGTTCSFGTSNQFRQLNGGLFISASSTMALSTGIGGDLQCASGFNNNGTFNANSRAVTFNGAASVISGSSVTTFAYLTFANTSSFIQLDSGIGIDNSFTINATPSSLFISATGSVTINNGAAATINGDINNYGSFTVANGANTVVNSTVTNNEGASFTNNGTLSFSAASNYKHSYNTSAGVIPTATWNAASTCSIVGYTSNNTAPAGLGQTFGNFTWNCPSQSANINLGGALTSIGNNLTINSTNASQLTLTNIASTINVGGDLIVSSGTLVLTSGIATLNLTARGLGISGGTLNLNSSATGTTNLNITTGSLNISGGTLSTTASATANINFIGGTICNVYRTGGTISGFLINFIVGTGSAPFTTFRLQNDFDLGTGSGTFSMNNFGGLDAQTFVLSGSGTFTVSGSDAYLTTANPNGISSSGATGSIQTTTRNFGVAVYAYSGTSAQITGSGLPATIERINVNNTSTTPLTLTNTISTNQVYFGRSLDLGANSVTCNGTTFESSTAYFITSGFGTVNKTVGGGGAFFPVGNSSYNPITLTNTGTSDVFSVRVTNANTTTNANDATKHILRSWYVNEGVAGGSNLSVVTQFNSADGAGGGITGSATPKIGFWNGTGWSEVTATRAGSNPYTFTSTTNAVPTTINYIIGIGEADAFLASSITYTWNGSTSTDFTTATNWTPNGIPTSTDNIIINIPGTNSLNITGSVSVNDFTLNGTGILNMAASSSLTINGNLTTGGSATASLNCSSTINIASAATQTVPAFTYGNLNISGGNRTLASSGTIGICGTFTPSAGTTTITGSTVQYSGATGTLSSFTTNVANRQYNNLILSGTGVWSLASGFNLGVAGDFSVTGTGTFNICNNTTANTMTVDGNFSIGATSAVVNIGNSTGVGTLNITGNFNHAGTSNFTVTNGSTPGALNITGNVSLTGSGTFQLLMNTSVTTSTTVTVGGNFNIGGASRVNMESVNNASATATSVINIAGNFTSTATSATFLNWGSGFSALSLAGNYINVTGNFDKSGTGTFYATGTGTSSNYGFVFNKNGLQTFSYTGTASSSTSYTINASSTLQLLSNFAIGTFAAAPPVAFNVNGVLDMQTFSITGMPNSATVGFFNLNAGGTIRTANTLGINDGTSSSALGGLNSLVVKSYSTSANYEFNGVAAQNTNFPAAITSMNNLKINNTSGVTLNQSEAVTGSLTLTNGKFDLGANTLISNGTITGTFSASNYIKTDPILGSKLIQTVASSAVVFPVGNSAYNPITLTNTGTSDVFAVSVSDANAATGANNTSKQVNRNWQITEGTAGGSNLTVVAQYNTADGAQASFAGGTTPKLGLFDGTMQAVTATAAGSNPFTYTSSSSFTPTSASYIIGIGKDDAFLQSTFTTAQNGDWNTASTWTGGVPPAGAVVVIAHDVVLTSVANTTTSITINSGASLTLNTGAYMLITASLNNAGTLSQNNNSILEFNNAFVFTNSGTYNLNSTGSNTFNDPNATLTNTATGVINFTQTNEGIAFSGANSSFINNGTFTMGAATEMSFNGAASTLTFGASSTNTLNASSTIYFGSTATINKNTNISFGNLNLNNATTFNGAGITKIFGKMSASFSTSVSGTTLRYQTGSTLSIFNTSIAANLNVSSGYWTPNTTYSATNGVPYDVAFSSSGAYPVVLPSGSVWKTGRNVTLEGFNNDTIVRFIGETEFNSLTIPANKMIRASNKVNLKGNLTIDGALSLSAFAASAELEVDSNVTVGTTGNLELNGKKLILDGTGNQNLEKTGGNLVLSKLLIDKTGGNVILNSNLELNGIGDILDFQTATTIDVNGKDLSFNNSTAANVNIEGNGVITTPISTAGNIYTNAALTFAGTSGNTLSIEKDIRFYVDNTNSLDFGTNTPALVSFDNQGALHIRNANANIQGVPRYTTDARLIYSFSGTRTIGNEWINNCGGGDNTPQNVTLASSAIINTLTGGQCYKINGSLTLLDNSVFNFHATSNQTMEIGGDISVATTAALNTSNLTTIELNGTASQNINTPNSPLSGNLDIKKNVSGDIVLGGNLSANIITFGTSNLANLDLKGSNNITLDPAGLLVNEGTNGKIINTANPTIGNGYISIAPATALSTPETNFGNLGLGLSSVATPTVNVIKRFPHAQPNVTTGSNASIDRVFQVSVASATQITYTYHYFDSELGIVNESSTNFKLYKSATQNGTYTSLGGTVNTGTNTITHSETSSTSFFITASENVSVLCKSTIAGGNWSDLSTWDSNQAPFNNPGASVEIYGNVTVDVDYDGTLPVSNLTVFAGNTLTFNSVSDLYVGGTIAANGNIALLSGAKTHFVNGANMVVAVGGLFDGQTGSNVTANGTLTIAGVTAFGGLTLNDATTLGATTTINDSLVFSGTANLLGTNKPTYASGSKLEYATGGNFSRGIEWSATAGPGYPYDVTINNGTNFDISGSNASINLGVANTLLVYGSTLNMSSVAYTGTLTVKNISSYGTLSLAPLPAKLIVNNGDIYNNNYFTAPIGSYIEITGNSATQAIGGYDYSFYGDIYLNKSANDLIITNGIALSNGTTLHFMNNNGVALPNGSGLYFRDGVTVDFGANNPTISGLGDLGAVGFTNTPMVFTGTGSLTVDCNFFINSYAGPGTINVDLGNGLVTVNKIFNIINYIPGNPSTVSGYPDYGTNSTLVLSLSDDFTVGSWWQPNLGTGSPKNVTVNSPAVLTFPNNNYYVSGNLTTTGSPNLTFNSSTTQLFISGNVSASAGTITPNGGKITLNGTANQTFTIGSSTLEDLTINKTLGTDVLLGSDISVNGTIDLQQGSIDLNGAHKINMTSNAFVSSETSSNTFKNSTLNVSPTSGYIEYTSAISSGNNSFAGLIPRFNSSTAGSMTIRRYPSFTGNVASGRAAYSNLFAFKASGSALSGNITVPYTLFTANGNTAGNNKIWTSSSISGTYTNNASTDNSTETTSNNPIAISNSAFTFVAVANPAPAAATFHSNVATGNFSSAGSWLEGLPTPGSNIIIKSGHNITVDANYTALSAFGTLNILSGGELTVDVNKTIYFSDSLRKDGTLTMQAGSVINMVGYSNVSCYNTPINSSTGKLIFRNGGVVDGYNATILSEVETFGSLKINQTLAVIDTLKISPGGKIVGPNSPSYFPNSTLVYATGGNYSQGREWTADNGGANYPTIVLPGYPNNIYVYAGTNLIIGDTLPSTARAINGNMYLKNTSVDLSLMTSNLTVKSFYASQAGGYNGSLTLSTTPNANIILNGGDFGCNNIIGNDRKIIFQGTTATQYFYGYTYNGHLVNNKTSGDLSIAGGPFGGGGCGIGCNSGNILELNYPGSNLIVAGTGLELSGSGNIYLGATVGNRNLLSGLLTFGWNGPGPFAVTGSGTLTINSTIRVGGGALVPAYTSTAIGNGKLIIANGGVYDVYGDGQATSGYPIYQTGSLLKYNLYGWQTPSGHSFPGTEWQTNGGAGTPYNVFIGYTSNPSFDFDFPNGNYYALGNIESTLNLNFAASTNLFVGGNLDVLQGKITMASTNTLTFNGSTFASKLLMPSANSLTNLNISKSNYNLRLGTAAIVSGNINFSSGNLNLNGNILDLGSTGTILNETNNRCITDSTGTGIGHVLLHKTALASLTSSNNNGIGFEAVPASGLLTDIEIRRYHKSILNLGVDSSVTRVYKLTSNTGPLNIKATIKYFGNELGTNIVNANMKMYRSINTLSGGFTPVATTSSNTTDPGAKSSTESSTLTMLASDMYFTAASADAAYVGTYAIPSATFPSVPAAVALLNASGVGTGGVTLTLGDNATINLLSPLEFNFTQNEPTATNPLIITGNPAALPTINAYVGGTLDRDAFIRVLGTDYLTIQNINFVDNNSDQLSTMEWGVALLKSGPGNGIRYNTIKNCHITMKKLNTISTGIYVGNHNADPLAPYTPNTVGGTNSNNSIYSNTISGVNTGIFVNSYDDPTNVYQDDNWKIGDTTDVLLGNLIENFGGEANVPAYGIRAKNTNQIIIGKNTINNTSLGGVACNNTIKGIEVSGASNSNSYIKHNNISLKQGPNAYSSYGIVGNMSGTQSINIERNNIHDNEMVTGASGNFIGVYSSTPPSTFNVKNNRISHNTNINTTGSFTGVYNLGASNVNITGNKVDTTITTATLDCYGYYINSGGTINCLNNTIIDYDQEGTGGGTFYGYCNDNAVVSAFQAGGGHEEISYNNFNIINVKGATNIFGIATSLSASRTKGTNVNALRKYTAVNGNITGLAIRQGSTIIGSDNNINNYTTAGNIDGLKMIEGAAVTLNNDSIYNFSQLANGNTNGINSSVAGLPNSARTISNNKIAGLSNTGGTGTTYGILHASTGSGGPHNSTNSGNRITNLTGNGSGATAGILHASAGSGPKGNVTTDNVVLNITGTGSGSTYGILHASTGAGGPHNNSRIGNTITNVTNTGSGGTYGILHASTGAGGPHNNTTKNNKISGLNSGASGSGSVYGILHASTGSGSVSERISGNKINDLESKADSTIAIQISDADSVNIQTNTIGGLRNTTNGSVTGLKVERFAANTIGIISNNVIGDIKTTSATGAQDLKGVEINGAAGTALKLYYNTIVLNDLNTSTGFGSAGLLFDNASSLDLRNNIIINKSATSATTGIASAIKTSGLGTNIASTSNNNLYFVDSAQTNVAFFNDGITPITSFAAFKAAAYAQNGREGSSVLENAVFTSLTLASAGYLRLDTLVATKAESGGSASNYGVTTDRNGALRFGAPGYVGFGSATDIGAFESNMNPATHIWLGKVSSNWGTAANWTGSKLPVATDDVIIPKVNTPTFYEPIVSSASAVNKIDVQKGVTITLSNADLTFGGNCSTYGVTTPNYVRVKGSGAFVTNGNSNIISGSWLVDNFAKSGAGTTTTISPTASALNIVGVYTPIAGTMATNARMYIRSYNTGAGATYMGTGQIAAGAGAITGNVTIERKATATLYASNHYLSSPITNANTVSQNYSDDFTVAGDYPYQYSPIGPAPIVWPTTWWYKSNSDSASLYRWFSAKDFIAAPGVGVAAMMNGLTTFDVEGTPQMSAADITVPVMVGRLNLVGNPYPSTIDLLSFIGNNAANIGGNVVYYYNAGTYVSYSSALGGTVVNSSYVDKRERFMGHSNGFFLYGKPGASQIVFKNSQRDAYPQLTIAAATGTFYEGNPSNILRIRVAETNNTGIFDELVIGTEENSTDGLDDVDGNKLMEGLNAHPYIYSVADGQNLVINVMPTTEGKVIPIGVITTKAGNWSIAIENSDAFVSEASSLILEDRAQGKFYNLKTNPTVAFNLPEGNVGSRFYLHVGDNTNAETTISNVEPQSKIKVFANDNKLFIDFGNKLTGTTTVEVFNMTGQRIVNLDASTYQGQREIALGQAANGNYLVKIVNDNNLYSQKVFINKK